MYVHNLYEDSCRKSRGKKPTLTRKQRNQLAADRRFFGNPVVSHIKLLSAMGMEYVSLQNLSQEFYGMSTWRLRRGVKIAIQEGYLANPTQPRCNRTHTFEPKYWPLINTEKNTSGTEKAVDSFWQAAAAKTTPGYCTNCQRLLATDNDSQALEITRESRKSALRRKAKKIPSKSRWQFLAAATATGALPQCANLASSNCYNSTNDVPANVVKTQVTERVEIDQTSQTININEPVQSAKGSLPPTPLFSPNSERETLRTLVRGVPPLTQNTNKPIQTAAEGEVAQTTGKSESETKGESMKASVKDGYGVVEFPCEPGVSAPEPSAPSCQPPVQVVPSAPVVPPTATQTAPTAPPALLGACSPKPRSGETPEPPAENPVPKKPSAWMMMKDEASLAGVTIPEGSFTSDVRAEHPDPPKPQVVDLSAYRTANKKPKTYKQKRREQARADKEKAAAAAAAESEVPTVRKPFKKQSATLASFLGNQPEEKTRKSRWTLRLEEHEQQQHRIKCHRVLSEARDQGLIPESVYQLLPALNVPRPRKLSPTMSLEGQVERLLRAYHGVMWRRFKKRSPRRFTGKQALKSEHYGPLFTKAVQALLHCEIEPILWVDWIAAQWVEEKYNGDYSVAKLPAMEYVFSESTIRPLRHMFRDAYGMPMQQVWSGLAEMELVSQAMWMERRLATFETVDELVSFWKNSELGQRWDSLYRAVQLERDQQTMMWEHQIALGEWISEWR